MKKAHKKVYALREYYGTERVNLVLLLDPGLLVEALDHLERGEVREALRDLREAADLYAGEWGTPAAELYERLVEEGARWQGVAEVDEEALEALEDERADFTLYPVLTGEGGLTLLLEMDWWHAEAGGITAYAMAHLPAGVLAEARKSVRARP